jgi:hypothetical protein
MPLEGSDPHTLPKLGSTSIMWTPKRRASIAISVMAAPRGVHKHHCAFVRPSLVIHEEGPDGLVTREAEVGDVVDDVLAVGRIDPPLDHHRGLEGAHLQHDEVLLAQGVALGV